nr:beta-myrcene synthase [Tanacetum cinerariifolium]
MAQPDNNTQLSYAFKTFFERETLTGVNFNDWYCLLRIVLRVADTYDYLYKPCLDQPLETASEEDKAAWKAEYKKHNDMVINLTRILVILLGTSICIAWGRQDDHTSDWLRTVPASGLGQTMNSKIYRCVLCYRLGIPLFSISKPCSACSRVFAGDIYGDHVVPCAGIIGIKHHHNVVRDTLVDICYRSGISAGKEVDIGLDGGLPTNFL